MDDRVKAVLEVLAVEAVFFVLAWYFEFLFGGGYGWYSKAAMILLGFAGIFLHRGVRRYGLVPRSIWFSLKWSAYIAVLFSVVSVVALLASFLLKIFRVVDLYVVFIDLVWFFVFVGFAEELFFRGYVQSRLNEVFTKRYESILGAKFEWCQGTLIAGVFFFGLPHLLTGINLFTGRVLFSPLLVMVTIFACFLGVVWGVIREKTGGVWVSSVMHGFIDFLTFGVGRFTGLLVSNIAAIVALFLFFYLMFPRLLLEEIRSSG